MRKASIWIVLIVMLSSVVPVAAAEGGRAAFYCSDGRDGSPVSACPSGYGPDDLFAAIDRKDSAFDKGDRIRVTGPSGSVDVRIVDVCGCSGRKIVDLPIGAFETIAGDWRPGVVSVTIQRLGEEPIPLAPATDIEVPS